MKKLMLGIILIIIVTVVNFKKDDIFYYYEVFKLKIIPNNNTTNIGPTEHKPTKPKLLSFSFLLTLTLARPTPRATIKGTLIGPVVTPPESNAKGINSFGVINSIKNIII